MYQLEHHTTSWLVYYTIFSYIQNVVWSRDSCRYFHWVCRILWIFRSLRWTRGRTRSKLGWIWFRWGRERKTYCHHGGRSDTPADKKHITQFWTQILYLDLFFSVKFGLVFCYGATRKRSGSDYVFLRENYFFVPLKINNVIQQQVNTLQDIQKLMLQSIFLVFNKKRQYSDYFNGNL